MVVVFVDESMDSNFFALGVAALESSIVAHSHNLLLREYKRLLARFGLKYRLGEAKFSYVLSMLAKRLNLERRFVEITVIRPIMRILSDKGFFVGFSMRRSSEPPQVFDDSIFTSRWFLKEYRRRFKRYTSTPKRRVLEYTKLLLLLIAPINNIERIIIDRNLGALGKHLSQLEVALEILTRKKVEVPKTHVDEMGIQIADFIAGASRYVSTNAKIFLDKNTMIFNAKPCNKLKRDQNRNR